MTSSESAAGQPAPGRFGPGSHLRVRRRWGYMHHGIYVSDDRVIQFGGRIKDKPNATISAVSLAEFEHGGVAEEVVHGRRGYFLPPLPEAQPVAKIIEQAEWLVDNYSPGRYHLIGNNCENIANWCVAGWYPESHQVRAGFGVAALVQFGAMLLGSYRQRHSHATSKWTLVAFVLTVVGVAAVVARNRHSKKFWQEFGLQWRAYVQAKDQDTHFHTENE